MKCSRHTHHSIPHASCALVFSVQLLFARTTSELATLVLGHLLQFALFTYMAWSVEMTLFPFLNTCTWHHFESFLGTLANHYKGEFLKAKGSPLHHKKVICLSKESFHTSECAKLKRTETAKCMASCSESVSYTLQKCKSLCDVKEPNILLYNPALDAPLKDVLVCYIDDLI